MFRNLIRAATRRGLQDRLRWRGPDGERGAILVIASVATVVALSCTAFAVDIGKGVQTKRNLQEAVDNAALDAILALGDRYGQLPGYTPAQHATKLAADSMKTNGYDTTNASAVTSFTVTLGSMDTTTNTFVAGGSPNTAVQVRASISRSRYFVPGNSGYSASGTASLRSEGGIAVGSWLARVNSTGLLNSLLSGLLGSGLTLVGYSGVLASNVSMGAMRQASNLPEVDDLLNTTMSVKTLLQRIATALQIQGDAASLAAVNDVLAMAASASSSLMLRLADLIKVCPGAGGLIDTVPLNVLQLAQMAAQVASAGTAIAVNIAASSLAGLGALLSPSGNAVTLKVIQPPQISIGPPGPVNGPCSTKAKTAQLRADIHLRPLGTILGGLVDLPIYIEVASADSTLTSITCANPVANSTATANVNTSLVRARIGNVSNINAANPTVSPGTIAGLVTISADVSVGGVSNQNLTFTPSSPTGPFGWSKTKSVGGTSLGLANLLNGDLHLGLLGIDLLGIVTGLVGALLHPILALLDALTDPLLALLGLNLGGADVTIFDVECNSRALVN